MARIDDWFLDPEERGNPATSIDRRRGDGRAWTEGNLVEALVHGAAYYPRLLAALRTLRALIAPLRSYCSRRRGRRLTLPPPGSLTPWRR